MSTKLPPLSARVTALERSQTILNARIEEIAEDVVDSFAAQAPYQTRIEEKIDALTEDVAAIKTTMATKEDLAALEQRMASKEDVTALEERMQGRMDTLEKRVLDAFQQLLTVIDQRLPPLEK